MLPLRALIVATTLAFAILPPGISVADDQARAASTAAMLREERLGDLRLEMPEKSVLKLLGKPAKQTPLQFQDADGSYVQEWHYPAQGLVLQMSAGEKKTGSKTVANFIATAPCAFATKRGIRVGSAESATRKAYATHVDRETPAERGTFVAGSTYGGIIFNFAKGKVESIFFGAAAE
jgi:hypothetical protein